jgi:Na+/H+-translocating membrane pyrophosphatase
MAGVNGIRCIMASFQNNAGGAWDNAAFEAGG